MIRISIREGRQGAGGGGSLEGVTADDEPTISAMAVRLVAFSAGTRGVTPEAFCARFGLAPEVLADVDGRVGVRTMLAIWEAVPSMFDDPDVGLHLGERAAQMGPALPWHLVRASATLGEGLARIVALWRVFNDLHPPELEVTDRSGVLRMRTKHTRCPAPRHATELAFVWFVEASRRATGHRVVPASLAFEHDAPADTREHARVFGCPVTFGADATSLEISTEDLARPTLGPDRELAELLHRQADAMLAKLGPPRGGAARAPTTARVRAALTPLLPTGDATIEKVAAALGASARSIQRRLEGEGATFQGVLDELRRELALDYLATDTHAIAEIALMLGFSDQSAFHRAFVRWTGRTPGEVRRSKR